jgi:hypothetical protein
MSVTSVSPETLLHLYRHLLREATYVLPLCRPYTTRRIRERFRRSRDKAPEEHLAGHLRQAQHGLRWLRAANAGDTLRMLKLCWHATGRRGKRKTDLINQFLRKSPMTDAEVLDIKAEARKQRLSELGVDREALGPRNGMKFRLALGQRSPINERPPWLEQWNEPKLLALATSQKGQDAISWPNVMRSRPDIQHARTKSWRKENTWGLPSTRRYRKKQQRRHWRGVMAQLAPPLPQTEWDLLRDLALGRASKAMSDMPPRRPAAQPLAEDKEQKGSATYQWEEFARRSIKRIELPSSRKFKALTGRQDGDPRGQRHALGVRAWKPRLLKRAIYGQLWETTPIMTERGPGRWKTTWGGEHTVSAATAIDSRYFEGVDAEGNIIKPSEQVAPAKRPR